MKTRIYLALILSLLLVLSNEIAFAAVGSTSLPKDPVTGARELRLRSGEKGTISIYPQNYKNESVYFSINITSGSEFLENKLEERYLIPPNTISDQYEINMIFMAPENAKTGDRFSVEYKMFEAPAETDKRGLVELSPPGFVKRFDIVVQEGVAEKETPEYTTFIVIGAICITLAAILIAVVILIKKRKKQH